MNPITPATVPELVVTTSGASEDPAIVSQPNVPVDEPSPSTSNADDLLETPTERFCEFDLRYQTPIEVNKTEISPRAPISNLTSDEAVLIDDSGEQRGAPRVYLPQLESFPRMAHWFYTDRNLKMSTLTRVQSSTSDHGFMPSIDKPLDQVYTFEEALDSYVTKSCPICHMIDCSMHLSDEFKLTVSKPSIVDVSSTITTVCERRCFLHIRDNPPKDNFNLANYSNNLKTMLNVLLPTCQRNYCLIAKVLAMDRCACEKVYLYDLVTKKPENELLPISTVFSKASTLSKNKYANMMVKMREERYTGMDTRNQNIARYPCSHLGEECKDNNNCHCFRKAVPCEKSCMCAKDCQLRFPGCNCATNSARCSSKKCICWDSSRECDPDLCSKCGVKMPIGSSITENIHCQNVAIQRGQHKQLLLAKSNVSGWGAFINESAEEGELIEEYVGECISEDEADRRGVLYDKQNLSYLFTLDDEFVLDSTAFGNLSRFINHSTLNANCYARVVAVNGEHRIGIFATRRIEKGEELLFDYCYNAENKLKFVPIEPLRQKDLFHFN